MVNAGIVLSISYNIFRYVKMSYNHFKSPKRHQPIPTLVENPVLKQSPVPCEQVVDCDAAVYSKITNLMRSNASWSEIEQAGMQSPRAAVPMHGSYLVSKIKDSDGRADFLDRDLRTTSMQALPSVGTSRIEPVQNRLNARKNGRVLDKDTTTRFPAL